MNNQTEIYTTINNNDVLIKGCNKTDFTYPAEYQALLLDVALYFENDLITLSWFESDFLRSYSIDTNSGFMFILNGITIEVTFNGITAIGTNLNIVMDNLDYLVCLHAKLATH